MNISKRILTENNKPWFICEVIQIFEDFLDMKGIELENSEKEEAIEDGQDEDSIANIYGTDYGWLQSDLEGTLEQWNLVKKEPINDENTKTMACIPGTDCTDCPKRYEVETNTGIESRCTDAEKSD